MRFLGRSLTGLFLLALTLAILALAVAMVAGALSDFAGRDQRSMPARERAYAVNLVTLEPTSVAPVLEVFGEVRARRSLEVRAQVGGEVVALGPNFEEGGKVAAGELLLRIDPTELKDALVLAETAVTEAEDGKSDAERALDIARDDLAAARQQAELRAQALARQKDLAARGVGTEAAVETAALADAAARQAVLSRRSALANAEAAVTAADNTLARRAIERGEAARKLAQTELSAAFTGTLSGVSAVVGRIVTQNEQVATLIDPDALEVAFRVSAAQYSRLLDADGHLAPLPVSARLGGEGVDLTAQGRIVRESAEVGDGLTGRLIFATLDAPRGFRPGDFVTVSVAEPALEGVALLPATAIDAAGNVLVLGDEDRLESAQVELLRRQGDSVIVRAPGLAGRELVAERSPVLGAGIKVRPVRPGEAGGAPGGQGMGGGQGAGAAPAGGEMIALDEARRAKLIDFVKANTRMPDEARARILKELEAPEVSAATVDRLESRMGG